MKAKPPTRLVTSLTLHSRTSWPQVPCPAAIAWMGSRNSSVNSSEWAILRANMPMPKAIPARMSLPVACSTRIIARMPKETSMPPNSPVMMSSTHVRLSRLAPVETVAAASLSSSGSMSKSVLPSRRRCSASSMSVCDFFTDAPFRASGHLTRVRDDTPRARCDDRARGGGWVQIRRRTTGPILPSAAGSWRA